MKKSYQVIFISHGGGPLPLLGDDSHQEMVNCLKQIGSIVNKPSAIIIISAHWEESIPAITAGSNPPLIYDYYGFPQESYDIKYPCLGEPVLAEKLHLALETAGLNSRLDKQRGFDHGVFVPLKIMYPAADIPCVQLSLLKGLDPKVHIKIGQVLHDLNLENVLVIGSGFSFHNMREFFTPDTETSRLKNQSFETWLIDTCSNTTISEEERTQRLISWHNAPSARFCHPRAEHLLPLQVCYGVVQSACSAYVELKILNKKSSMYLWNT